MGRLILIDCLLLILVLVHRLGRLVWCWLLGLLLVDCFLVLLEVRVGILVGHHADAGLWF